MESKEMWEKAKSVYLSTLQSPSEKNQVDRYLSSVKEVVQTNGNFIITTASPYASDFLKEKYSERLKKCLELFSNGPVNELKFKCDNSISSPIVPPINLQYGERLSSFNSTMPLNEDYTFDEFVRGPSNSWALAAAQGVVKNPGKKGYNPLFIHGGTGLGKTHLMQAIGNELRKLNSSLSICYLTAETFLNEYVNALKNNQLDQFRNRYRKIDLLMVDDVQFLQNRHQFQEEFFNTFNALSDDHKQIVMTSDVAPKNLPALEARLISRFEGGMVQEIESPNYETRLAILKKKSESIDNKIPETALEFIADKIKSHVRAIEGALLKVSIFRTSDPTVPLTNDILAALLKDFILKEQTAKKLTIEEIQTAVAKKYSVSIAQIISFERTQSLVTPRQVAMYISRKYTTKSLPEIAQSFGKTHATIIHGIKNIQNRLDVDLELKKNITEILSTFDLKLLDKMDE